MLASKLWDQLAACLDYPDSGTAEAAIAAAHYLEGESGGAELTAALYELAGWLSSAAHGAPEERYTILFDLKPVCTLNISHHILGDTYARGALLAELSGELVRAGLALNQDLPDYLPTLLSLLGRLEKTEDRRLLVHTLLLPGLDKVNAALRESPGPWPKLLRALPSLLEVQVPKGDDDVPVFRRSLEVLPCSM